MAERTVPSRRPISYVRRPEDPDDPAGGAVSGAVLFDLDGCLVDSTSVITACLDHALATVAGHAPRDPATLRWAVGPPLLHSVESLLGPDAEAALVDACLTAYRDRYRTVAGRATEVFPGVPELLVDLADEHRPLAVVTSKPGPIATWLLGEVGLLGHFLVVHGPSLGAEGERKAVTLRRALTDLGAEAASATMVGDRSHDVVAGREVGVRTIGVTWGAGDRDELETAGADVVVDDLGGLRTVLCNGARVRHG